MADLLLMHKAFVNAKSKLGLTPLHLASQNGYNKLVKVLIEKHGATIDALSLVRGADGLRTDRRAVDVH